MMTHYKLNSIWIAALAMVLPASAATGHHVITAGQIAAAISGAGVNVSAKQITLLTEILARSGAPVLRVQSMEPLGDHRMRVRLACADIEECVPFYVAMDGNGESPARPRSIPPALGRAPAHMARVGTEADPPTMRAGSPATLLLEGDHMQIQLHVVCLENGSIGQTIRVASKDRKQIYTAQVFDGGILRGSL